MSARRTNKVEDNWDNYWRGQIGNASGSAYLDQKKQAEIDAFWASALEAQSRGEPVLDLACGAGAVSEVLTRVGFTNIFALDISKAAVDALKTRFPEINAEAGKAECLPFSDEKFETICSQYGFEYGAERAVIPEIGRVLKSGGVFVALAHYAGGEIHEGVLNQLGELTAIKETAFMKVGPGFFRASMKQMSKKSAEKFEQKFRLADEKMAKLSQDQKGLAEHLYVSVHQMYQRRQYHDLNDILEWFQKMRDEIDHFIGRLTSMKLAAIDQDKLQRIEKLMTEAGLRLETPEPFIDQNGGVLGWKLKGVKQSETN